MRPPFPIKLDAEDRLLCVIGERLLRECGDKFRLDGTPERHNGRGNIEKYAKAWNNSMQTDGVRLILMDMDSLANPENRRVCPSSEIQRILGGHSKHPNFLLRIAVCEAESWLLADWSGLKKFFGVTANCEAHPDSLEDAKEYIHDIIIRHGDPDRQRRINKYLADFASKTWSPMRAAKRSKSLRRTLARLKSFPA